VISSTHVQYGSTADLVARWRNGQRDRSARRDIWLTSDGQVWNVRAGQGGAGGREVVYDFTREHEARAMVGPADRDRAGRVEGHHQTRPQAGQPRRGEHLSRTKRQKLASRALI
jgi:hypothetical protein